MYDWHLLFHLSGSVVMEGPQKCTDTPKSFPCLYKQQHFAPFESVSVHTQPPQGQWNQEEDTCGSCLQARAYLGRELPRCFSRWPRRRVWVLGRRSRPLDLQILLPCREGCSQGKARVDSLKGQNQDEVPTTYSRLGTTTDLPRGLPGFLCLLSFTEVICRGSNQRFHCSHCPSWQKHSFLPDHS